MNIVTTSTRNEVMALAGHAANRAAAANVFADYKRRKAPATVAAQAHDLAAFAEFLGLAGIPTDGESLQNGGAAWQGMTWGIVKSFVEHMLGAGLAIGTINRRLSTVKTYSKLAAQAGAIGAQDLAMIKTVGGYGQKEAKRVNKGRDTEGTGRQKSGAVIFDDAAAEELKSQPDTPQGRRDRLLMCLLIDHGLRAGEVADLAVEDFNMGLGEMTFYRSKVDKRQTHRLSRQTLEAVSNWLATDGPKNGPLLRGSRKGGDLTEQGLSRVSISQRVRSLGAEAGVEGLSAHDCRHHWATRWASKVDVFRLQEAGGWNSLAMPRRYVEFAKIANEGMN